MHKKSKHGGRRLGSGRKQKWSFNEVLKIGHACEKRWQAAQAIAFKKRMSELSSEKSDLKYLWNHAASIPVPDRRAWRESEDGNTHSSDVKNELIALSAQVGDAEQKSDVASPNAVISISTKPPPGSRKRIIEEVSVEFEITAKQTDNIWQQYRRFEH
jgi:hypothetical protein